MKLQSMLVSGLLAFSGSSLAEGGCEPGYTPVNNGQNWTCIPGGNDSPEEQTQRNAPPRPTGYWEKTWGAIAPSPKGGILGTALGASSKKEAERLALADCKAKGGGECQVDLVYHNQCAALVVGKNRMRLQGAASIEAASKLAMSRCESSDTSCRVYYSACTEPIYHQY